MPPEYLDAAPALTGGWRVIYVRSGARLQSQAIVSTSADVLAVCALLALPLSTSDATLRAAARVARIALAGEEVACG